MNQYCLNKIDQFGCLLTDFKFEAGDYEICPNENFSHNLKLLQNRINEDNFLYPPLTIRWSFDPDTKKKNNK